MKKIKKVTILLTTHDMSEISQVCDRAIFIDKGKIILDENIDELMKINIATRDVTIITENKKPVELKETFGVDVDYGDHRISLKKVDKYMIFKLIEGIMEKNQIKDITIREESFTDVVKKIYLKGEELYEKS